MRLCSKAETARVSVSELYQLKPIAFRWTGTSSTRDQLFFGYPGRSEQTSWEKLHEALRLIGSTSSTESSLLFTSPSIPSHRRNQPSIVKRSILDFRLTTHYHAYPHHAVKTRPKELEAVRWKILAAAGHPKCAAFLVKNLLHMVGIITDGASITNDNTQPGQMRHDIEIVKELVRRQTHKGREIRRFGPYEHPGFLPRSSLDPGWWHWRRVFGTPWKDATEHINALELRALLAAVQWRLRVPADVHSKGLHIADSFVVLGAVSKGRSSGTVANSRCKAQFSDVGSFFYRYLGMCPHGRQSGGQALTRAMTKKKKKKTERQRARLKARTRCHSRNKLRLRDIIVRPKTF